MAGRVMVRDGLFTDGDAPALLGSRCAACGAHHFPRHDTCPYCAAEGPLPAQLGGAGRLWAWTAVTAAMLAIGRAAGGSGPIAAPRSVTGRRFLNRPRSRPGAVGLGLRSLGGDAPRRTQLQPPAPDPAMGISPALLHA